MPFGGYRRSYHFPHGTQRPLKVMFVVLFANFSASFAVTLWAERYAPRKPSVTWSFPVHFKGGVVAFVPSWMGYYDQWSFWSHFVILGVLGLMFWWYVRKGHAVRVH
jgi:hypothetical protein